MQFFERMIAAGEEARLIFTSELPLSAMCQDICICEEDFWVKLIKGVFEGED